MNINIARELKAIRVRENLRMEDVASNVGIALETLRRYEKDASKITVGFLTKLLEFYHVDDYYFFTNVCDKTHGKE